MGIDASAVTILSAAKRLGADFDRSITIGRQFFTPPVDVVRQAFRANGLTHEPAVLLEGDGYAEPFFKAMGADTADSLDYSDFEGATHVHDMNTALPENLKRKYSLVYDGGSLEHIFNAPQAIKNCMELVSVGGHFVQTTNANNFVGHGFWQFSPELLYRVFSPINGFAIRCVVIQEVDYDGWRGPHYLTLDPANVGWRVEFRTRRPTYIMTIAKRVALAPIFATYPQQHDYVLKWTDRDSEAGNEASSLQRKAITLARRIMPAGLERALRSNYNSKAFVRLGDTDLMWGKLPAGLGPEAEEQVRN